MFGRLSKSKSWRSARQPWARDWRGGISICYEFLGIDGDTDQVVRMIARQASRLLGAND